MFRLFVLAFYWHLVRMVSRIVITGIDDEKRC